MMECSVLPPQSRKHVYTKNSKSSERVPDMYVRFYTYYSACVYHALRLVERHRWSHDVSSTEYKTSVTRVMYESLKLSLER